MLSNQFAFPSLADRSAIAEQLLATYEFGQGVTVADCNSFCLDDPRDLTAIVYVEYDDDAPDSDSHKVSFHVRFDDEGCVEDVYALEMEKGNDLGAMCSDAAALIGERTLSVSA